MPPEIVTRLNVEIAGIIKALAITSRTRVVAAPEVPTVEESSGIKGFELVSWYGVWGPRGLPPEIVTRLNVEIAGIIKQPEVQQRLLAIGFEPVGSSAAEFSKYIASEMAKYEKIIKEANIKAD